MLNTDKILYILPDVAYLAELLPGKQEYNYQVSNFHQINGKFLDDNEFLAENVVKLLAKFEQDTYRLVLPDFLFTNTILNIKESSETAVKEYLKEKVLPQLDISHKTHQIQFYVLTQHKGVFKVQLSAIENSLLAPIKAAANQYGLTLEKIYPLSWTTKSLISLEPSVSVVQMGSKLYLAQHYIGVDQTNDTDTSDSEKLVETIKTLKGAEPSIQTIYLATSKLIEDKFKTGLKDMLPVQQLADDASAGEMPSYVKLLIEAGMKTLSIPDFQLPEFNFVKVAADQAALTMAKDKVEEQAEEVTPAESAKEPDQEEPASSPVTPSDESDLPKPAILADETVREKAEELAKPAVQVKTLDLDEESAEEVAPEADPTPSLASLKTTASPTVVTRGFSSFEDDSEEDTLPVKSSETDDSTSQLKAKKEEPATIHLDDQPDVDLSQFSQESEETEDKPVFKINSSDQESDSDSDVTDTPVTHEQKPVMMSDNSKELVKESAMSDQISSSTKTEIKEKDVIKNKSGIGGMLKTVFVFLASVAVTVAIGIGLGLGFIKFTNKTDSEKVAETPVVEEIPQPTPTVMPTPEPTPEVDKEKYQILVVNATSISGHAGETKTALTKDGFANVSATNAKGDYEEGIYVLLAEEDAAMVKLLSKSSGLDLVYQDGKKTEDPSDKYDAVIVLAK